MGMALSEAAALAVAFGVIGDVFLKERDYGKEKRVFI